MISGRAVDEFYVAYHRKFHRYAYRIVGNSELAADLVQEALTRALPSLLGTDPERVVDPDRWPNFLYRTIHNLAINAVTRSREDAADPAELSVARRADHAEATVVSIDVQRCLDRLAPEERAAYLLAAFEGFYQHEVAELLGLASADAAYRRIRTAERKLRRCLAVDATDA